MGHDDRADIDEIRNAAGTLLASYDYELADNGRRDSVTEVTRQDDASLATVMLNWAYDALDRLIGETRVTGVPSTSYDDTYTYDLVGNRLGKIHTSNSQTTTVAYAYNDRDQLLTETATGTSAYATVYGYDDNGSLTSKVRTGTDVETDAYEYDLNNRLIHVTVTDDQNNVTEYEYGYDSKGNRVLKQVTPDGGSTTTTTYLVDSNNGTGYAQVYEETSYVSGGPTTVTSYLIGDDVLAQSTDGQVSFLNYDGHGSTRFLTDVDGLIRSASRYHYDAFGMAFGFDPATATTHLLYTGEQFDTGLHEYYLRARYYDPAIGQFSSFDFGYEGVSYEPLTLHKYLYAGDNPVMYVDASGNEFTFVSTLVTVGIQSLLGASLGVAINAANNYAQGRALTYGAYQAALGGALLAPAAVAFPLLGLGLAGYGVYAASGTVRTVFANPNSTVGQKATAVALLGASIFGMYAAGKQVKLGGFWEESPTGVAGGALDEVSITPSGQPQPTLRSVPRTPQDIAVNGTPPPANNGAGTIGGNANQAAALQRYVGELTKMGAQDIRVNQQQINIAGQRVGINRPDLQFTYDGRRWYIEWDTSKSLRGIPHGERIMANDPSGMVLLYNMD